MGKRTIIFRADGGPSIGMGHFIRSLALAEMLNEDFQCVFATRKPTAYQIEEIEKVCHSRIDLPEDDTHFERFLSYLKGNEIVVLDNYYFDTEYQRAIKGKGCKLVCIDDIHDKHYVADIVINHALTDSTLFDIEPFTKLFLGIEYALIRKPFRFNQQKERRRNGILIHFGGSDSLNLTYQILGYLIKHNIHKSFNLHVMTGNANLNAYSIKKLCSINNVEYFHNISAKQLAELMESCLFAILPTSTIAIEALYRNVRVIGGYFVDNQVDFFNYLLAKKYIIPIGNLAINKNFSKIQEALRSEDLTNEIHITQKHQELITEISQL